MPDGFERLIEEHAEVARRFEQLARTGDDALIGDICAALTRHTHAEEAVVYPELRRLVDGGDDLADEAQQEHAAVQLVIERLELSPHDNVREVVEELRGLVEAHVAEEEQRVFPAMRDAGVDADALFDRLGQVRAQIEAQTGG